MKSYAIKNIYTIGVYRAIGINKRSIVSVYFLEILFITLRTILVSCTLCFLVTNIVSGYPNANTSMEISFNTYLLVTLGLMVVSVIIGILPISLYMRLTPSNIISKYDI